MLDALEEETMEPLAQSILIGVTGKGENTDALRFGVSQAQTLGCDVTLVHAVHPMLPPPPPSILITDADWTETGRAIVGASRRELEELLDGAPLEVRTVSRQGDPGHVLGELSKDARLVVLQHRDLSRLHRVFTGSTVASTATHSACPVVSVPAASPGRTLKGVITAGVDSEGAPRQVLEAAFAEASVRRCSLRVVHAWRIAAGYESMVPSATLWNDQDEARLTAPVDELKLKYPDVAVGVEVHHDWPADVLVAAAQESDLLVVGRHRGLPGIPHRIGSLARATIEHAVCPVMIVPV